MSKIGLMGGTFNPVHNGHLILAQEALEQFSLDAVWFLPNRRPPHKDNQELPEDKNRLEMLKLALAGNTAFSISLLEMQRTGKEETYTYDTMLELKQKYPQEQFYFMIGGDSLLYLHKWYRYEELLKGMVFLAAVRGGMVQSRDELEKTAQIFREKYGARIHFIKMPQIEISSTALRHRAAAGKSLQYYMPDGVAEYITARRLYSK